MNTSYFDGQWQCMGRLILTVTLKNCSTVYFDSHSSVYECNLLLADSIVLTIN